MKRAEYLKLTKLACAYFFICTGLSYGLLTSRLPSLKEQTGANEAQIGIILLCLGLAGLTSLLISGWLIAKVGIKTVLRIGTLLLIIAVILCGVATSPILLGCACILAGLGTGLADVSMNAQGILIERKFMTSCMSFMHASYSIGGVAGALTGALFAAFNLGPFANAVCVLGLYACGRPWAIRRLLPDIIMRKESKQTSSSKGVPIFVVICGILAMFTFSSEGSVAEWGSLLLYNVKGASESVAACVFAVFSATTVFSRLTGDKLRYKIGDFTLTFFGALLATGGMSIVLFTPFPLLCLAGYGLMGVGLAPIVPVLYSRAGSYPGITPGKASAIVSVLSYGGLLFIPPLIGFAAQRVGLNNALLAILLLCCIVACGTIILKNNSKRG